MLSRSCQKLKDIFAIRQNCKKPDILSIFYLSFEILSAYFLYNWSIDSNSLSMFAFLGITNGIQIAFACAKPMVIIFQSINFITFSCSNRFYIIYILLVVILNGFGKISAFFIIRIHFSKKSYYFYKYTIPILIYYKLHLQFYIIAPLK